MIRKYLISLGIFAFLGFVFVVQASAFSKPEVVNVSLDTLVAYQSPHSDYSFQKPKSWDVYEIPSMSYARLENFDARKISPTDINLARRYFKIEIVKLSNPLSLSLHGWVDKQNTSTHPSPIVLKQTDMTVGGYPAIYQVEQYGSLVHPAIFVQIGDNILILNISPNYSEHQADIDRFLSSFQFEYK